MPKWTGTELVGNLNRRKKEELGQDEFSFVETSICSCHQIPSSWFSYLLDLRPSNEGGTLNQEDPRGLLASQSSQHGEFWVKWKEELVSKKLRWKAVNL